ncbi:alpha/beta hydrolase fold domain-containing protein [Pseudomonas sp. R-28-1W-6]|uniref:alpha/beta hydrolase n=1 Tax=Pseudomonas sp. R-28-1W-6 TaxID=2650101 RepID=UPI0013666622|nr:alpha/beta hydrolase [Pseudomonas sp. R-28-1W-6]MWV12520.1 alpha/beta hydrolase fold domain-containing protein [Pseudomonas sp. R-28-1W-6]
MTWSVELAAPTGAGQRLLTALLRGLTWLLFRAGLRPGVGVPTQRRLLRWGTRLAPVARGVRVTPGELGGVPCEWLQPARDNGWVLLYLHGGAFIVGAPQTHRSLTSYLARHGQLRVCALDYRLAPEHPFPAARDDVLAAYRALLAQGQPAERIVIAGDSAGGNLALVGALRLRELGLPLPAALVCLSPFSDVSGANLHAPAAGDPLLQAAWLEQGVAAYCPAGMDRRDPQLSPLYAELHGLSPLLVQVGEDEMLLRHSQLLARRAVAAGVDCRLELYRRQWHVFQINCGLLAGADQALQRLLDFLRQRGCPCPLS